MLIRLHCTFNPANEKDLSREERYMSKYPSLPTLYALESMRKDSLSNWLAALVKAQLFFLNLKKI